MATINRPPKPSKVPATLVTLGSILTLGPIWGFIGSLIGMMRGFHTMGQEGMGKPEALAADIGISLISTAVGILICPIGIVILFIGIRWMIKQRKATEA